MVNFQTGLKNKMEYTVRAIYIKSKTKTIILLTSFPNGY